MATVVWTGKNCPEVSALLNIETECGDSCKNHKLYLLWINALPYWAIIGDSITRNGDELTLESPKRNFAVSGSLTSTVSDNFISL